MGFSLGTGSKTSAEFIDVGPSIDAGSRLERLPTEDIGLRARVKLSAGANLKVREGPVIAHSWGARRGLIWVAGSGPGRKPDLTKLVGDFSNKRKPKESKMKVFAKFFWISELISNGLANRLEL